MKKIIIILVVIISLGFIATDNYITVQEDGNYFNIFFENDSVIIQSNVPLIMKVPNIIDLTETLEAMQMQIDSLQEQVNELETINQELIKEGDTVIIKNVN